MSATGFDMLLTVLQHKMTAVMHFHSKLVITLKLCNEKQQAQPGCVNGVCLSSAAPPPSGPGHFVLTCPGLSPSPHSPD